MVGRSKSWWSILRADGMPDQVPAKAVSDMEALERSKVYEGRVWRSTRWVKVWFWEAGDAPETIDLCEYDWLDSSENVS